MAKKLKPSTLSKEPKGVTWLQKFMSVSKTRTTIMKPEKQIALLWE